MSEKNVIIYTDGACSGNPGPGGYGVVLCYQKQQKQLSQGFRLTTNNRMELTAAIAALEILKRPSKVHIHTDSTYLRDGITIWIHNWKRNGWRSSTKKKVKNIDLWQRLDEAIRCHDIQWHWVKGHSGDPGNEAADALARQGLDAYGRDCT